VELWVGRLKDGTNKVVLAFFTTISMLAMGLMGLDIDTAVVWSVIKRPVGPAVGMASQFIFMPAFSYLLGWAFLQTNFERLGLLLLGCSPGGANSNFWTAMFDGDVNLSVTMTFLSSVASFAFTTLWIKLLGSQILGQDVYIPYERIAISLVSFSVPLLIGVAVKYKWPKKASQFKAKVSKPFFLTVLILAPITAMIDNRHFFYLVSWRHIVSGMSLGVLGYIFGAACAAMARMGKPQIIAISLETAMQNGGIAFVVLNLSFPSPLSDMGLLPILSFFLFSTGPIMFLVFIIYISAKKIKERLKFKSVPTKDEKEDPGTSP